VDPKPTGPGGTGSCGIAAGTAGGLDSTSSNVVIPSGMSYEFTRRNHTECLVQGDVMTFRIASLPWR
jgi:hypothetical protein